MSRKKWVTIGSVVAVLAVAAIGFNAWHETPGFCSAICHKTMDAYVRTVALGDEDKYGNKLDSVESEGMAAFLHKEVAGTACLQCHVGVIGEQVTEGMSWVAGDYYALGENPDGNYVLTPRTTEDLGKWPGFETGMEFCLRPGCHVTETGEDLPTRDQLIEATKYLSEERNPHQIKHTEHECSDCHHGHSQSVNQCSACHDDAPIPQGWIDVETAKEKQVVG